jgi:tol-pal system protein YbgF
MSALRRAVPWLLAGAAALALPAHALFDDNEARKAIVDLRARVDANDQQAKARAAELAAVNAQLLEQLGALRRSLLELNNQLEAVRGDLAKLRGEDEQIARQLAEVQRAQRDASQALDERLRKLEPLKVSLDGAEFSAEPAEKAAYDEAIATIRGGDFAKAVTALGAFQRRFPGSGYGDSVRFWLGNALYGKGDHKGAVEAFRAFVAAAPQHPRAPEALLALANSQAELKDPRAARATLEELLKTYPQSEAAQAGRQRLAALPPATGGAPARR